MQLKQYSFDKNLAENGRRVELGEESYIVVARWNNKNFNAMFAELTAPYGAGANIARRLSKLEPELQEDILLQVVAKTIVLDWGGIEDGPDEIPYTHDNVVAMFKKYPDFSDEVMEMAKEFSLFQTEEMAEELGNSNALLNTDSN